MHQLSFQGEKYVDSKTASSNLVPAGAIQATFKEMQDGSIMATSPALLNMKVGQIIAFVPSDALRSKSHS